MAKGERKRAMVYSNVNRKADKKSAFQNREVIDLDNEIVIGLETFNKSDNMKGNKKNQTSSKNKNGQAYEKSKNGGGKKKATWRERIKKKNKRLLKKMSITVLMFVLIIGGIIYFFLSPAFNVKAIEVLNNNFISKEQIINLSGIKMNDNMFKFSKNEAENKILSNPYIEDVNISRNIFKDEVEINVKERVATLMLEYGNSYVYINNQGYILEISAIKLNSPILKGYVTPLEQVKPGNRLSKEDLTRLETVLSIIETANSNDIGDLITQIDISNKNSYIMYMETEDKIVYLGDCSNLAAQMPWVKEMLKREKGIEGEFFVDMDLNTGRPVFREKV